MQFDFYITEAGQGGSCQFRLLESAHLEISPESAVAAVNTRFQELVSSNPEIQSIIVASSIGGPPGQVVAAELVHAWPVDVRQRQGKPPRELVWVVDGRSTGLQGAPVLA